MIPVKGMIKIFWALKRHNLKIDYNNNIFIQ